MEKPNVVESPALAPLVIDERTAATKSGPEKMSAGMKMPNTPVKINTGPNLRFFQLGGLVEVHMVTEIMHRAV